MQPPYAYQGRIDRVIDGDTVVVEIDLGFRVKTLEVCRLYGINAPEIHGATKPQGAAATTYLKALLGTGNVILKSFKDPEDKYGRWLVVLFDQNAQNINDAMVEAGHAVVYKP